MIDEFAPKTTMQVGDNIKCICDPIYLGMKGKLYSIDGNLRIEFSYSVRDKIYVKVILINPWRILFEYVEGGSHIFDDDNHDYEYWLTDLQNRLDILMSESSGKNYQVIFNEVKSIITDSIENTSDIKELFETHEIKGMNITYKPNIITARFIIGMTIIFVMGYAVMSIIARKILLHPLLILAFGFLVLFSFISSINMNTELVFTEDGITVRKKGKDDVFYSWEDLPYASYETFLTRVYIILSSRKLSATEKTRILGLSVTFPLGEKGVFVIWPGNQACNTREVVNLIENRYGIRYKPYG